MHPTDARRPGEAEYRAKPALVKPPPRRAGLSPLFLREQDARIVGEAFGAAGGHAEALRDDDAPAFEPNGRDAVKGHALLERGLVALPQARRQFAPGRRVADADRIADAAVLVDAVACDGALPHRRQFFAEDARLDAVEHRREPL